MADSIPLPGPGMRSRPPVSVGPVREVASAGGRADRTARTAGSGYTVTKPATANRIV